MSSIVLPKTYRAPISAVLILGYSSQIEIEKFLPKDWHKRVVKTSVQSLLGPAVNGNVGNRHRRHFQCSSSFLLNYF